MNMPENTEDAVIGAVVAKIIEALETLPRDMSKPDIIFAVIVCVVRAIGASPQQYARAQRSKASRELTLPGETAEVALGLELKAGDAIIITQALKLLQGAVRLQSTDRRFIKAVSNLAERFSEMAETAGDVSTEPREWNIHSLALEAFDPAEARRIAECLEIHYTPD